MTTYFRADSDGGNFGRIAWRNATQFDDGKVYWDHYWPRWSARITNWKLEATDESGRVVFIQQGSKGTAFIA